jgi:ATP-dependent DNA helicase RecQ
VASPDPLRDSLRSLFGHDDFRPGQREIVEATVAGEDVLAVLPTGGGKSLTYQLPAMLADGATLILSPLIALMKDQAEGLPPAVAERTTLINSSLSASEVGRRLAWIKSGRIRLVYAAPERLRQPTFLHALRQAGVALVVIDEAHCISQWGHDFRPDYRAVGQAIAALAPRSVLAVTATAPPDVQFDICQQLGRTMRRIVRPTWRENLHLSCRKVKGEDDKLFAAVALCQEVDGPGLIYATSREKCEQLARMLKRQGVAAGFYHAGLPTEERAAAQDRFMAGETRVMAATVAFGMGVDKADIRFLLHYHPSRTLENYYQEAGRAGRDGDPSACTLLYSPSDGASATRRANEDTLTLASVRAVYDAVRSAVGRSRCAPVAFATLSAGVGGDDALVRGALPVLEELGLLTRHVDLPRRLTLWPDPGLPGDAPTDEPDPDWPLLERAIGGGGEFAPGALSQETGISLATLEETLLRAQDAGHLTYRAGPRELLVELLPPPGDTKARLEALLQHRAEAAALKSAAMQGYARTDKCRHEQIARYFGDPWPHRRCGQCDICAPRSVRARAPRVETTASGDPLAALRVVADLATGRSPFALGKAGLLRTLRGTPDAPVREGRTRGFGALSDWRKADVERLIEALIEQGYLRRDDTDEYRRLFLTESGQQTIIDGTLDIDWRGATTVAAEAAATDADPVLLATLKAWRRETASEAGAPPYVVFADKVLGAIAAHKPRNEFDLLAIPGIGPAKAARFGVAVLEIVRCHEAMP